MKWTIPALSRQLASTRHTNLKKKQKNSTLGPLIHHTKSGRGGAVGCSAGLNNSWKGGEDLISYSHWCLSIFPEKIWQYTGRAVHYDHGFMQCVKCACLCVLAKVVCIRVIELLRRGAGVGQCSAQTALMNHHIQQGTGLSHLHHRVQRPHSQVGTVLERLARSEDTPIINIFNYFTKTLTSFF